MIDPESHEMKLQRTYPSGAEEWLCPSCGRWFVMHHQEEHRKLKMVVLEDGDDQVQHFGSRGPVGLNISAAEVKADETAVPADRGTLH